VAGMKLQGTNISTSTATWTDIYTIPTPVSKHYTERQYNEFPIDTGGASYRYYRLNSAANTYENIAEYRLIGNASTTTNYQPVAPIMSPMGGRFDKPINVRISSLTTDATLYYTTDGSIPSVIAGVPQGTTLQYTTPFVISNTNSTTTIRSIAVLDGNNVSDTSDSAQFIIDKSFRPGQDWFDNNGKLIESHGGEIKYFNGKYYWYGTSFNIAPSENVSPSAANSVGVVTTYSSPDLVNWTDEGQAFYVRGVRMIGTHILYNQNTSTYVLWGHNVLSNHRAVVATSSSPTGPFTLATSTLNPDAGVNFVDFNLFQDTDGTGYVIYNVTSNAMIISKLAPDYLSTLGVGNYVTAYTGSANKVGQAMFKKDNVYFLMSTSHNTWGTTTPQYATSTSPLGTWSTAVNPFQPSGSADYTTGYFSQSTHIIQIPGRTNAFMYMGDRYDNSNLSGNATNTSSLYNSRHVLLPITFPTPSSMSISYSPTWTLDGAFVSTNPPTAPSGLAATKVGQTVSLSWANNEANSFSIFLDRATDSSFTQNVVSEVLTSTTTSFVDSSVVDGTVYYFRIRISNGSGTTNSSTVSFSLTADTNPPSVTLISPINDATLSGTTTLSATSTDDMGVASIKFLIDGIQTGTTSTTSPYSIVWDSSSVENGTHTVEVVAIDTSGNPATSTVSVTVSNIQSPSISIPTMSVQPASSITTTSATLNGNIVSINNASSTMRGFNYGTTTSYGLSTSTNGTYDTGSYSQSINGLLCATTYHYQSFSINSAGTGTSTDQTFTTSACPMSSISISPSSIMQNATSTSVTVIGVNTSWTAGTPGTPTFSLTGGNSASIVSQIISGSTSAILNINSGSATGTLIITDPSSNSTTSVSVISAASASTLTTDVATSVTASSVTLNGTITSTGSASPTTRGFQYGGSIYYGATTTESGVFSTGAFSVSLTGIGCSSTYHFRAYASSTDGFTYGADRTFTTSACGNANATGEIQFSVGGSYGYGITGDNGYLNQGNRYYKAYDGDFTTYWDSNATNPWMALDLTTLGRATRIKIAPALGSTARIAGSILQGATVNPQSGPWTNIYTIPTGYYPQRQFTELPVDTGGASYRYYRIYTPSGLGGNISEFRVIGLPGNTTPYQPVTPVIGPMGGHFPTPIKVRISSLTTSASVYYTTDGTDPTFSAGSPHGTTQLYTAPILVNSTTTIKSIAVSEGQFVSDVSDPARFFIGTQFVPGSDWYDTTGHLIESHSGEVKFFNGKYYWYGQIQNTYMPEWERVGVSCYSSTDLVNWKDEGPVLYLATTTSPISSNAIIVERPHVIYNSSTGKYVLWGHNWVGGTGSGSMALIAQSNLPYGPFTIVTQAYDPNGYGLNDMNLFKDDDGTAYVIYSSATDSNGHFFISKLSSDYLTTLSGQYVNPPTLMGANKREAPAMVKRNGVYFLLGSGVTGWGINENKYATSSSPLGTWSSLVNEFQPSVLEDYTLAYRSQGTNVITIPGRTEGYIYMGDRFDPGLSAGGAANQNWGALLLYGTRHVWLPVTFPTDNTMSISYSPSWTLDDAFVTSQGPQAATGFTAIKSGLSSSLAWTNNEINGYTLYVDRATDSNFTQNMFSDLINSSNTTYNDPYVSYGTTYFYRLRTVTAAGTSFSETKSIDFGSAPDVTVPTVSILSPTVSATISGTSTVITASSSDNIGITSVQFYIDATSTDAMGTTTQYSIVWDSTTVADGAHIISVVVSDAAGNTASSSVNINVSNTVNRPTISSVHISSSNSYSGYAKTDDVITLTFISDQNLINNPIVTIAGHAVTATSTGVSNNYIANYTMHSSDSEGSIPFTIDFTDTLSVNGFTVSSTNDSSYIVYDKTGPIINIAGLPVDNEYSSVFSYSYASSTDTRSGIASYLWSKISGLGNVTFSSPTSAITNISADNNDNYVVRLTVTDRVGNISTSDFNFTWVPTTGLSVVDVGPVGSNVSTADGISTITFNKNITLLNSGKITLVDNVTGVSKKTNVSVANGDGNSAILNISYSGLESNKDYRLTINQNAIRDDSGITNGTNIYYFHTASSNATATLAVTGIDAIKTYAISDGTYANGWKWVFHITVPDAENSFSLRFDNWTNGSNSISVANNMRYYSTQSSNKSNMNNPVNITKIGSYEADIMNLNSDLDPTKSGRQVDVTVEVAIPVGSVGGSYSTSYNIHTE
jgi:hypothetical protein